MGSALIKHLIAKSITDKEFRKKIIIIFIALIAFSFFIVTTIINLPSLIINGLFGEDVEDINKIQMYQNAILTIDENNQNWIDKIKEENSDCHSFDVKYNYNLTWYELMAIDSVRYSQDFEDVVKEDIIALGNKFLKKSVDVEEYEEEVEKEEEVEYEVKVLDENGEPMLDEDGNPITEIIIEIETYTEIETRRKAIITIETKEYEDVLEDVDIVDEEEILLANNIYETLLSLDIEGDLNIYDANVDLSNLIEYPAGYAKIPYYNQTDARWGSLPYGNSTIYSGGCGPTSLAMVVAGLTENKVTPDIVANWSYGNGHRAEGQGSYWSLIPEGGAYYGLDVKTASRRQPNRITEALSNGNVVIASMGKGHFTNGGHFIVLRGITDEGKILVHDSASVERSNKEWELSIIMNESSTNGGVNGSPFWIFTK